MVDDALEHELNVARAPPADGDQYVRSAEGKWHRAPPSGRVGATAYWVCACGWKFAAGVSLLQEQMPDVPYKVLCARCFPSLRKELKALLQVEVSQQIGEEP